MFFFRAEKLALQPGMTQHHKGRRLFAFEVHGPAAIGVGRLMGDIEMLTMMAVRSFSLLLLHLVLQPYAFRLKP